MPASLANSAGSLLSTGVHFQMTRPGMRFMGRIRRTCRTDRLTRVVTWQARILQLRHAKAGDRVGYGGTYSSDRDLRIATIGVGYADGYNRKLGGKATVLIGTQTAPVIGRVSMDSITVDVTDIDPAHLQHGSVELLHDDYDLSRMAGDADTIAYEILTGLEHARTLLPKFIKMVLTVAKKWKYRHNQKIILAITIVTTASNAQLYPKYRSDGPNVFVGSRPC